MKYRVLIIRDVSLFLGQLGVERSAVMNRHSRFDKLPLVAVLLFCSDIPLSTSVVAGISTADPVEITFETSAPYYEPQLAVVSAGSPVRWVNPTASPHSVRHDDCLTDAMCAFQSIAVPPDSSFSIAPLPPGRYGYHCELHPIMRGVLIVRDPGLEAAGSR
jgi:plastocyanin